MMRVDCEQNTRGIGALTAAALASAIIATIAVAFGSAVHARNQQTASAMSAPLREVAFCELAKNPSAFDNSRVRLTAFVNFAFEDFTLWDPGCARADSDFALWVTYGGTANSGAIYCCPGEATPRSGVASHPLVEDKTFQDFRGLLAKEHDTVVRATVVGTLLVRKEAKTPIERLTGGYGHMGCCSLFVIERVESFEPHTRNHLDYSASSGYSAGRNLHCKVGAEEWELKGPDGKVLLGPSFEGGARFMQEQAAADDGERAWAFDDPARVAIEAVRSVHRDAVKTLRRTKVLQGLQVFEWEHSRRVTTVVVARPYWLSTYAKTSQVAWVVTAMKTAWCE